MARNLAIQHIRTTRANLDIQATANNLKAGEIYLITDENRIAIGLTVSTYETYAKASEDSAKVTIAQTTPQTIGATGSRLTKLWATDLTVTNAIDAPNALPVGGTLGQNLTKISATNFAVAWTDPSSGSSTPGWVTLLHPNYGWF